jgi:hypothetical protein
MNMKTRLTKVVSVVAVGCLALILSNTAVAQMKTGSGSNDNYKPQQNNQLDPNKMAQKSTGGGNVATQISPQDAAKKYPAPKGKYPMGERDPHKPDGIVNSPYPPRTEFDCSQVPHGALVVDTHVNKVFVRP